MDFFYALERHNNLCAIRNKRDYVIFLSEVLKVALVSSVFTSSRRLEEGCEFVKIDGETTDYQFTHYDKFNQLESLLSIFLTMEMEILCR